MAQRRGLIATCCQSPSLRQCSFSAPRPLGTVLRCFKPQTVATHAQQTSTRARKPSGLAQSSFSSSPVLWLFGSSLAALCTGCTAVAQLPRVSGQSSTVASQFAAAEKVQKRQKVRKRRILVLRRKQLARSCNQFSGRLFCCSPKLCIRAELCWQQMSA